MLPTYLEPDTITIRDKDENIMLQNAHQTYKASLPIFQKYIELPVVSLKQKRDRETVICVWFVLIAGKASSIGIRAGEKITGNESYYLPVGIKGEK